MRNLGIETGFPALIPIFICTLQVFPSPKCRRLATVAVFLVEQIPDQRLLDHKTPAGAGDSDPFVVVDEAFSGDLRQQARPLFPADRLRRQPGGGAGKRFPRHFPKGQRGFVSVIEEGVVFDAVGNDHERGMKKLFGESA